MQYMVKWPKTSMMTSNVQTRVFNLFKLVVKPEMNSPDVGLADDSRLLPTAEPCLEKGLCPPIARTRQENQAKRSRSKTSGEPKHIVTNLSRHYFLFTRQLPWTKSLSSCSASLDCFKFSFLKGNDKLTCTQWFESFTGLYLQVRKYRAIFNTTCSLKYCQIQ